MHSLWLAAIAAVLFAILAIALVRLYSDVCALKRAKKEADSSGELRHFEYNALISEVSALLEDKVKQEKLKHELTVAKAIQETLLPENAHHTYGELSVYGKVRMQNACGGDWWYHSRKGDQVTLWIGDVTGHGVPSALIASACRAAVGSFAEMGITDAKTAMTKLNRILFPMMKSNMLVSAICLSVDLTTGKTTVVNASHPHAVLINNQREATGLIEVRNPLLGFTEAHEYEGTELHLNEDEILILLTDGLLDFPRPQKPMWSDRRFYNFITKAAKRELHLMSIMSELEEKLQTTGEQEDDITYVAIQRNRKAG